MIAARKLGVDSVCLLTMGTYESGFGLCPIFPYWMSDTSVLYGMRILDARSGRLLLDVVRRRFTGGPYTIHLPGHLATVFTSDLKAVLGPLTGDPARPVNVSMARKSAP